MMLAADDFDVNPSPVKRRPLHRTFSHALIKSKGMSPDAFEVQWDITGTSRYLAGRGFTKAALQFPDELLQEAARVAAALERACAALGHAAHAVVLADTSYHSVGVDEVAAAHADAHCVVSVAQHHHHWLMAAVCATSAENARAGGGGGGAAH